MKSQNFTKRKLKIFLTLIFFLLANRVNGQINNTSNSIPAWYATGSFGIQMSGIKDEDFVGNNYSPVYILSFGRWVSSKIAIEVGYRGTYFNTIAPEDNGAKHFYNFFYGNAVFDLKSIFLPESRNISYKFFVKAGLGYFYNFYYRSPDLYPSATFTTNVLIRPNFYILFNASSIIGWDIYQGDLDILPSMSFGLKHTF